ncbi:hypothetical protein AAVH_39141 [Aphelenchoides avenae]|nr:hypothetical protein AAVH_39141 [Aphelenchus avenae]
MSVKHLSSEHMADLPAEEVPDRRPSAAGRLTTAAPSGGPAEQQSAAVWAKGAEPSRSAAEPLGDHAPVRQPRVHSEEHLACD